MILKSRAIALRVVPFSRTSQIVSWLTPEHGRLVTLAKGAQRPRSAFQGQLDVFYTCEVVYYAPQRSGLATLKECATLASREALRQDVRPSVCASYVCDLVHRLTPIGAPQERLFRFLELCLDTLGSRPAALSGRILHWAELRMMGLLGMAPRLSCCSVCGRTSSPEAPLNVIAIATGGAVCGGCRSRADGPFISLGLDSIAILRSWQEAETPERAQRTSCNADQRVNIGKTLGALLTYHLELPPGREIALDLLGG